MTWKNLAHIILPSLYKIPGNAIDNLMIYLQRDEQEKYFEQMKSQMNFRTQDCSSEDGKQGRLFLLFIGLILTSIIKKHGSIQKY